MSTLSSSPSSCTMLSPAMLRQLHGIAQRAAAAWQGCDWETSFGPRQLNLRGMKPRQTRLLAEATCGEEARVWDEATVWLQTVEQDARDAASAAYLAIAMLADHRHAEALHQLEHAVSLEAKYRPSVTWRALQDRITGASSSSE